MSKIKTIRVSATTVERLGAGLVLVPFFAACYYVPSDGKELAALVTSFALVLVGALLMSMVPNE